tara:strand:- start:412 stop:585 length:174 start_codon:yes stop_codon:yes gene_type:complete
LAKNYGISRRDIFSKTASLYVVASFNFQPLPAVADDKEALLTTNAGGDAPGRYDSEL